MVLVTLLQVGAMFGGLGQVMHLLFPAVPVRAWVLIFLGITLALLLGGGYERIERLAVVKVGLFTLLTLMAAVLITRRPDFSWSARGPGADASQLPTAGLFTAVAVFGVTGVGTNELAMYPNWCVEKGYARFAGPRDGSAAWARRARGWIRVMHVDILVSLIIYTVATIAFYLLGAGVLHAMGLTPKGNDMIVVLSRIYTETLGGWALLGVLRRGHRHPLRHHLRRHRRPLPHLRRHGPAAGLLPARRLRHPRPLPPGDGRGADAWCRWVCIS